MSLVLAASIGARTRAEMVVAAVLIRTVAIGDADARIETSGITPAPVNSGTRTSFSAIPNMAAKKLLKNVSNVRVRIL